jgi:hypothetical protein
MAQEIEQFAGLAAARAEVNVGNEKRAEVSRPERCHQHSAALP